MIEPRWQKMAIEHLMGMPMEEFMARAAVFQEEPLPETMRECYDEMGRLADYLIATFPGEVTANQSGRTVDTVIALLERLRQKDGEEICP